MSTEREKHIKHLRRDPILRALIKKMPDARHDWYGRVRRDYFRSLVMAMVNQQLSGKAAATIFGRFLELFPGTKFPKPEVVLKMPTAKLRKVGLSKMKVSFMKDLAKRIVSGDLDFKKVAKMEDEEVIKHLTRVKGIGRWTAEMFLMFSLRRPDVFSYGDLGLRNAMQKLYGLKKTPTPRQAEKISAAWKPYRTLASLYLWASIDKE